MELPDGEEAECRICRGGHEGGALLHPCRCAGSIKYVHQECLDQWLARSSGASKRCELCHHPFTFSPVYADNAPSRLPTTEFAMGLLKLVAKRTLLAMRTTLVLFLWVVCLPVGTSWMCRLFFMRSLQSVFTLTDRLEGSAVLGDWMQGVLLSVVVVGCFLAVSALRDYMIRHEIENPPPALAPRNPPPIPAPEVHEDERGVPLVNPPEPRNWEVVHRGDGVHFVDHQAAAAAADGFGGEGEVEDDDEEMEVWGAFEGEDFFGNPIRPRNGGVGGLLEIEGEVEVPLEEFVGLRGPMRQMLENALTALIFNALFIAVITLVPFTLGRVVLSAKESLLWVLSRRKGGSAPAPRQVEYGDYVILLTGYASIVASLLMLIISLLIINMRNGSNPPSPLLRQVVVAMRYLGVILKVCLLLGLELIIFPTGCGWWLDLCSLQLVNASVGDRVAYFNANPWTAHFLHWLVGVVLMLHICVIVALLREIVRPEVLWFLRNPADPDEHPFRDLIEEPVPKHLRRVALSVLLYMPLTACFVYCPVTLTKMFVPWILPVHVSLHNPYKEIPIEVLLMQITLPFAVEHFRPQDTFKRILYLWLKMVGDLTGLTHRILPASPDIHVPDDDDDYDEDDEDHEDEDFNTDEDDEEEDEVARAVRGSAGARARRKRRATWVKVSVILAIAWVCVSVSGAVWLAMPIVVGRRLLEAIGGGVKQDIYTFAIGFYVAGLAWEALSSLIFLVASQGLSPVIETLQNSRKWLEKALSMALGLGALPLAAGFVVDLTFGVPWRIAHDQDMLVKPVPLWVLGIATLKVGLRLVHSVTWLAPPARRALLAVQPANRQLDLVTVLQKFRYDLLPPLLVLIALPYSFSFYALPFLGLSQSACYSTWRTIFPLSAAVGIAWLLLSRAISSVMHVHETIRDSMYLVGRKLHNIES